MRLDNRYLKKALLFEFRTKQTLVHVKDDIITKWLDNLFDNVLLAKSIRKRYPIKVERGMCGSVREEAVGPPQHPPDFC